MQGKERHEKEMTGKARQGRARQGKTRKGKERQGKARKGKKRQGKERQGKNLQGKNAWTDKESIQGHSCKKFDCTAIGQRNREHDGLAIARGTTQLQQQARLLRRTCKCSVSLRALWGLARCSGDRPSVHGLMTCMAS